MPKYQNAEYAKIGKGNIFGVIDIVGSAIDIFEADSKLEPNLQKWFDYENKLRRLFTVLCSESQQMFILTLSDLTRMKTEFEEHYFEIFNEKVDRLKKLLAIKKHSNAKCAKL